MHSPRLMAFLGMRAQKRDMRKKRQTKKRVHLSLKR
jgi:hypothetical protein